MTGGRVVGIDVGGTFTDVFTVDDATGEFRVAKVPSTRRREADGFMSGVTTVAPDPGSLSAIVHGTTVGTNALLERTGARTGLITTAGFRDVLEMRRRDRPQTWGLWGDFSPVVPRDLRIEVAERTGADGEIVVPVDREEVVAAANALLEQGVDAVCVAFINSYANAANERAAAEAVREVWPQGHVTSAVEILPEIREFERISTGALNAYLQPVVGDYLSDLDRRLDDNGFRGHFFIVQSNGGVMTSAAAEALPVRTALSGPAAGVIASQHLAGAVGHDNVITCDMGGTSFDVAVIAHGETVASDQTSVDFGLVIRTPMIEISTIGAGGGSIAWVDGGGLLRIGPESAGSIPGPACYGRGNEQPTVTDAHLVLGRINGETPIGGLERLDVAAARDAIDTHVGSKLGLGIDDAAEAILRVATSHMAGAIRLVSLERGHDPSAFVAMPFGGAGALHACGLVSDVGLEGALVPRYPGVVSAYGCVIADVRHDVVQTLNWLLDTLDGEDLTRHLDTAETELREFLADSGLELDDVELRHELDMSYVGQTHTVAVRLPHGSIDREAVATAFEEAYTRSYGRVLEGIGVRVLSARSIIVGGRHRIDPAAFAPAADAVAAPETIRSVYFDGAWHDARIVDRLSLPAGAVVEGPAVLEQPDATTVVEPGFSATVDDHGNLFVSSR